MEKLENPARRQLFRGTYKPSPEFRLPWILDEKTFLAGCTQCLECIPACETQILVRDKLGYPKVDFSLGNQECSFCEACIKSCPEPLFKHQKNTAPWPAELTIAADCLAYNEVFCQSCGDVCETRAISFGFNGSAIPKPEVDLEACTQCGACLVTCPQDAIELKQRKS